MAAPGNRIGKKEKNEDFYNKFPNYKPLKLVRTAPKTEKEKAIQRKSYKKPVPIKKS